MTMDPPKPSSFRWVILLLIVASFILTCLSRYLWAPLIPVVAPVFKINNALAGSYMTAFYIGYVITQIPAGVLADRLGVKYVLGISLLIEGLSQIAFIYIASFDAGFWLRMVTGLGAGAIYSACSRAVVDWFPAKERGTAFGILLASPALGIILSNLLVPVLNKLVGWQGVFMVIGFFTGAMGVLVTFLVHTSSRPKESNVNLFGGFKVIFSNRDLILTTLAGFCMVWGELGMATWANSYIKQKLGYSVSVAGLVMIFYGIGGIFGPLLSGLVSDKLRDRKNLMILSFVMQIPFIIIFGHQQTMPKLCFVGFIVGFFQYLANPLFPAKISDLVGKEWSATANGTTNFVFQLAAMIVPLVLGWSIDFTGSFGSVWLIMASGPLVGIFLLLAIKKKGIPQTDTILPISANS